MIQDELDERCVRWGHLERRILFCPNPQCPSRVPEKWEQLRELYALKDDIADGGGAGDRRRG